MKTASKVFIIISIVGASILLLMGIILSLISNNSKIGLIYVLYIILGAVKLMIAFPALEKLDTTKNMTI